MKYSAWNIFRQGITGNSGWPMAWRKPEPKADYDIIVVGGGGHGLATAYYLASQFGQHRVAVLEKGWIGGGNAGRNTTIVRSNYMLPGNQPFYEFSLKLWENLEQELNYNVVMSQRGMLNLLHSDAQRDGAARRGNAMLMSGADAELMDRPALEQEFPFLDFDNVRFPIRALPF